MTEALLLQILLLLGVAVTSVVIFQRLQIPASLGYLLVGILLGPFTPGPIIEAAKIQPLAEFGIVFLLFTIGLNYSLPQIQALRGLVLGLGTAQVFLTTLVIGVLAWWLIDLPVAAAFVVGAVFAQSSTTIISPTLTERGEENSRHGRLGTAMSVFQDVTAVPLLIIIPALGMADAGPMALASSLGIAVGKSVLAFLLVFVIGRKVLLPLFHLVAAQRSTEVFTLTVLLVSLCAAWITQKLDMSTAFGAFLAGMVLGETEFRHQVESTIRPFKDVLLGLFFIGVGMMFDLSIISEIWYWGLAGAVILLLSKVLIVVLIARLAHIDSLTAWRIGWILAVGGEFGFALLAIALGLQAIDPDIGQVVFTSVLFSMILGPFLIRYNNTLAHLLVRKRDLVVDTDQPAPTLQPAGDFHDHVIICGYGRIGQSVAHFLEKEQIPFVAMDLDATKTRQANLAGENVFYGDATERGILEAIGIAKAKLLIISYDDVTSALKILRHVRELNPDIPVMVRTRDEHHVDELRAAGASEVVPEILEAGFMISLQALLLMDTPMHRVMQHMQQQREQRYHLLRGFFRGDTALQEPGHKEASDRLHPVVLASECRAAGNTIQSLNLDSVAVTALVRQGQRQLSPNRDTVLEAGDVLVLFGAPDDLAEAERNILQARGKAAPQAEPDMNKETP